MDLFLDCLKAFLVGGGICLVCQLIIDYTKLTPARILVALVVSGVVLNALGVYKPLYEWAGAGAAVPLLGFGNTLAEGVKKAVEEQGIFGVLMGGLTATSAGVTTAIFCGFITALFSKPKSK